MISSSHRQLLSARNSRKKELSSNAAWLPTSKNHQTDELKPDRCEFRQVDPEEFVIARSQSAHRLVSVPHAERPEAISRVRAALFLTPHTAAQFRQRQTATFLNSPGNAGFALSSDHELQNLFSTHHKGTGRRAVIQAVALGANRLVAIGENLARFYSGLGWSFISSAQFDPDFAPPGWPYASLGSPPVVTLNYLRAPIVSH